MLRVSASLICFRQTFSPPWWQAVEVVGTGGVLSLPQPFFVPSELTALEAALNGSVEQVHAANHQRLVEHFADVVLNGAPFRYPAAEAVAQMRALDALARAARDRRSCTLS